MTVFVGSSNADIYRYKDPSGITVITSLRPRLANYSVYEENCARGLFRCVRHVKQNYRYNTVTPTKYREKVLEASNRYGVDSALIKAVIHAESAFNKHATSSKGAMGLMQLMPETAKRYGVTDAFNAEQNINGGVQYLSYLLKLFNKDIRLASAAYNAGENAVLKYNGIPPFPETQKYVAKVARLHRQYKYGY